MVALGVCLEFWIVPKAIEKLAGDRADKVSKSVDNYIQKYFGKPEEILRANKNAIDYQDLKLEQENQEPLKRYLWRQVKLTDSVSYVHLSNKSKYFMGVEDLNNKTILRIKESQDTSITCYTFDRQGNVTANKALCNESLSLDPTSRTWFQDAIKQEGKPVWSSIYQFVSQEQDQQRYGITVAAAIKKDWVLAFDFPLSPLNRFLSKLERSNNNQNLYAKILLSIIDSCEKIIVTSNEEIIVTSNKDENQPNKNKKCNQGLINIKGSEQNLIQETNQAQKSFLQSIIGDIDIETITKITNITTKNFIVKVTPLNYPPQQKWSMIVAIPRESVKKEIMPQIVKAKLLCILLAIIVGIIFWLFLVRPIINSIQSLLEATEAIEKKNYELPSLKDANDRGDELALLVKKFQQMAMKICDREQIMEQKLEQQRLEPPGESSIKQGWEQVKQELDIHEKAELVMQIIDKHESQQLINIKKDNHIIN